MEILLIKFESIAGFFTIVLLGFFTIVLPSIEGRGLHSLCMIKLEIGCP